MFSASEGHSKNDLEEVMTLHSVSNPLSDIKGELIGNVRQNLQTISTDINSASTQELQMDEIQSLSLQNKPTELLSNSSALESQRSLELPSFSQQPHSSHAENEMPLESIGSTDNTLTLDHTNYYDSLNNTSIMVYHMPPGSLVPFESLVSVPVNKTIEDKSHETEELLHTNYSSKEVYNSSSQPVSQPLYLVPDVLKFKGHDPNEKMMISQIYSSEDSNLFLDPRHTFAKNNKCEMSMTDTLNAADLNLATISNFDSNIPISSEADIHQFPIQTTYTSTETDSEVALTLASLGNLKTDKIVENELQGPRIMDNTIKMESHPIKQTPNIETNLPQTKNRFEDDGRGEYVPTLVLRSRRGRGQSGTLEAKNKAEKQPKKLSVRKTNSKARQSSLRNNASNKTKISDSRKDQNRPTSQLGEKSQHCEPRKENLLGQLLKASKHCEPASLIPEGVVDDVIPAVGYRIMDMSNLGEMIRMMHRCSNTVSKGGIVIQEQASLRDGAVSQLSIICTGCQEGAICSTSNKIEETVFDINSRVSQLTKEFDIKESQVQRMLEILGIFYRPSDQRVEPKPPPCPVAPKPEEDVENVKKEKKPRKGREKNIECQVCHKKFSGLHYLKSHMVIHDNLLHTCPYCQAYFKRVFNLQEHIKKHENVRYECDICHKSYTDRSTLYAHKKSFHQLIYKEECEICSKRFFHKIHYVEHMRIHTGEKPYACDICGKRYPYVNSVKKHKQSHCTVAKYKCRLCGKWFRWFFGIRQHLCQQHKLKKCDVDAQVIITDVIAETLPVTSSSKKSNAVFRSHDGLGLKGVQRLNQSNVNSNTKNGNSSGGSNVNVGDNTNVQVTTSTNQFHPPGNTSSTSFTNLNDWKKPL